MLVSEGVSNQICRKPAPAAAAAAARKQESTEWKIFFLANEREAECERKLLLYLNILDVNFHSEMMFIK